MSDRPLVYSIKKIETFFMDFTTGVGVTSTGRHFRAETSRGYKNPSLKDKLDLVGYLSDQTEREARIMFTGKVPKALPGKASNTRHWLDVDTGDWMVDQQFGHWKAIPPTGRFHHRQNKKYVEVRTAAEWFGSTALNPVQVQQSFQVLDALISDAFGSVLPAGDRTALMKSPGATGQRLWAVSIPTAMPLTPVTDDIAEELHATSGQHHLEHSVAGPDLDSHPDVVPLIDPKVSPEVNNFSYVDGRFMYASLCRGIGLGPGRRYNRTQTADLLREDPYLRARIQVKFQVPDTWRHVGLFGVQHPDAQDGWYWPNRPGAQGIAWVDASEFFVAEKFGWILDPVESVVFSKKMPSQRKRFHGDDSKARRHLVEAKPLDTWASKIVSARTSIESDGSLEPWLKSALGAALRAILIQTIGSFASRGRGGSVTVDDPRNIPAEYLSSAEQQGKKWVYYKPSALGQRQKQNYRPEYAVQIWGRGRAKTLWHRAGDQQCGALTMEGNQVIGINGDAVYSTTVPQWSLPSSQNGADDGKTGRMRLQGLLRGPVKTPQTRQDRDRLRDRAIKDGAKVQIGDLMDQASFDLEFDVPNDDPRAYTSSEEQQG
ncbi:hypothetical protein [Kocuria massiliensis]|uniref:hypothetical protein n=1 Tax=Kocuria massiliensis TaxID=1926282 RepID=UPI0022B9534B|nr:hypothetical protein [Kocuria massiliensis]